MTLLDEADVAAAPVYDSAEALADPHFKHKGAVVEVEHPKIGKVGLLRSPLSFSDTPVRQRTRPPLYGENTAEVLQELAGITEREIEGLKNEGAIE
jgi:crotonobetainyl-CoA:carnitine CoA-transferase CaiB-like acyl-CoA transferase